MHLDTVKYPQRENHPCLSSTAAELENRTHPGKTASNAPSLTQMGTLDGRIDPPVLISAWRGGFIRVALTECTFLKTQCHHP